MFSPKLLFVSLVLQSRLITSLGKKVPLKSNISAMKCSFFVIPWNLAHDQMTFDYNKKASKLHQQLQ